MELNMMGSPDMDKVSRWRVMSIDEYSQLIAL